MPSDGLRGPFRSAGWPFRRERRLGGRLDVELAVDLAADERAPDELDAHADLAEDSPVGRAAAASDRPPPAGRPRDA